MKAQTREIPELSNKLFGYILVALLIFQFAAGLWHVSYPFIDGRIHYNWGPPFWLMHAKATNDVGLVNSAFGVEGYRSHPQLMGPVIALWTRAAGYSEASIRILSLLLSTLATLFLALGGRSLLGNRRGFALALFFVALPVIYIYGRTLNQEVLVTVFLALTLWGMGLIERRHRLGLTLVAIGSLGMALSDWSGFVFAGFLALVTPFVWRWPDNRATIIKVAACACAGAALGLGIFLLQSYIQAGAPDLRSLTSDYYQLWQYRAGATDGYSWFTWLRRQIDFFARNFSIPLLLISVGTVIAVAIKKLFPDDSRARTAAILALAILAAQITYSQIVIQASGVHIYFQYFYSIPIAFGMVFFVDFVTNKLLVKDRLMAWAFLCGALFIVTAGYAAYQYNFVLFRASGMDITDIQLIQSLHDIPPQESIIAVNTDPLESVWYDNPNIEYYAGRPIKTYLYEAFPDADYLIVPRAYSAEFLKQLDHLEGSGETVSASLGLCSKYLCLLHLTQ